MNGWRIDYDAASAAVAATRTALSRLDDAEAAIHAAVDGATGVTSGKTSDALTVLAQDPFLAQIANVRAAVTRAADQLDQALAAYTGGDEEMASNLMKGLGR